MSGKPCTKCGKTAYPLESLVAGDDTYHKLCFKCTSCDITLSLKTFKKADGKIWCPTCTPKAKHTQVADSVLTKAALSAPKVTSGFVAAHKGDSRTAPKVATFGNDKQVQSGEFESEVSASTADTGIGGKAVQESQSGEFESTPQASHAETGGSWGNQPVETSGLDD
ncbi:Zinc-binding domain present in Lin-11, Isl-1, Mec-3 [Balamuthia mandrillaris]